MTPPLWAAPCGRGAWNASCHSRRTVSTGRNEKAQAPASPLKGDRKKPDESSGGSGTFSGFSLARRPPARKQIPQSLSILQPLSSLSKEFVFKAEPSG